jgi:hypothetical protein
MKDMAKMAPIQELVVKDLSGMEWHFQHRLGARYSISELANHTMQGRCRISLSIEKSEYRI